MVDANIIFSAIHRPNNRFDRLLDFIVREHTLVIASYTIPEVYDAISRKYRDKITFVSDFFTNTRYELFQTPADIPPGLFHIRDPKDYPVLYSAIVAGVDIFITGDKDFAAVDIDKPQILTPAQFLDTYPD
jgi:predicted nucleic acid-binding protein